MHSKIIFEDYFGEFVFLYGSGHLKCFQVNSFLNQGFPTDFTPFHPGLEMKFAIEEGEKNKA